MGYSVLKSNEFVPEEVERRREISELRGKIETCADEEQKRKLIKLLNEKNPALSLLPERNKLRHKRF